MRGVCKHTCMHMYIHLCIPGTDISVHACMVIHMHTHRGIPVLVHMHAHTCRCVNMYICTRVYTDTWLHTCMCTHTPALTSTDLHTHAPAHACSYTHEHTCGCAYMHIWPHMGALGPVPSLVEWGVGDRCCIEPTLCHRCRAHSGQRRVPLLHERDISPHAAAPSRYIPQDTLRWPVLSCANGMGRGRAPCWAGGREPCRAQGAACRGD